MRRLKKSPPPVLVENPKKKQKKGKRSAKKSFCKENTEPAVTKKETKMYTGWDICGKLNRDTKSIYDELHKHILTETELRMNHFPHEGYKPWTQVAADDCGRQCVRCGEKFDIFNGVYLSASKCNHHPRKPAFVSGVRLHGCCNAPAGTPPCATSNHHVTLQHRPRALAKTSSRRHVRKDLQHSVFSLDCEMCYTTDGLEVVRVGLVNIDGLPVYDGYVKPKGKILDYNTMYSGVEKSHLQNVTVTLDDVKTILSGYIQEDTILVGHALNNDLSALGLIHSTIVDTSVLYADPRTPSKKTALKKLASYYLGLKIKDSASDHDCIDDARATLQLALLKVPATVPMPFSEQTEQQPAAKQQAAEAYLWKHEQRPLVEIQNFDCRFRHETFDFCQQAFGAHKPLWCIIQILVVILRI
ncbi:Putative exonuclease GOR [Araneus ventricosus]|uniref:Exonuclease GOR n=1 Tax=Araneus ventricosus TaxID=182803 RepID=A0A4Y2KIP6_ARAVE|nr:Putative exonuclease GOR [Araneus ventricosus]